MGEGRWSGNLSACDLNKSRVGVISDNPMPEFIKHAHRGTSITIQIRHVFSLLDKMSTKIASSGSVHVFTAPQSKNADVLTLDESKLTTQETSNLQTLMVDDLVRQRAHHHPNHRVVSYPSSGISFVDYTLQQLDIFAWRVAKHYAKWLPPRRTSSQMPEVIGLLGPSNFEYLITLLALTKLGHSVLLLSTRITIAAVESLIKQTASNALIAHERCNDTAKAIGHLMPDVDLLDIAQRSIFEFGTDGDCDTRMTPLLDPGQEQNYIAFIIHSSGKPSQKTFLNRSCHMLIIARINWTTQANIPNTQSVPSELCYRTRHEGLYNTAAIPQSWHMQFLPCIAFDNVATYL